MFSGRSLVTLLTALTLVLGGSTGARAAEWEIKEAPLASAGITSETLSSSGGSFDLAVPTLGLTIHCTAESGSGEIVKGGATGKVSIELSGCAVSKFEKACSVKSAGKSTGVIGITATTKFFETEVKEVEKGYEELTPTTTIEISGAECAFPAKFEMSGATAAEVPKLEEEVTKRAQKFSKAIAEESGVTSMKLGKSQAFLTGEDKESLSGAHKEEAMAVTNVTVDPLSLVFVKTFDPRSVLIKNLGPRKIEISKVEVEAGAFVRNDPEGCIGGTFEAAQSCLVPVECISLPSAGKLLVEWDVLNAGGKVVGFGKRRVLLSCGAA